MGTAVTPEMLERPQEALFAEAEIEGDHLREHMYFWCFRSQLPEKVLFSRHDRQQHLTHGCGAMLVLVSLADRACCLMVRERERENGEKQ